MTSRYTLAEIERFTTPDLNLSQYLRPALSYRDYFRKYLAGSLESEEWRDKVEEEKAAKARASAGGVARGVDAGTSKWWVHVTSAGGEAGDIDIPRPPADFPRLSAPVRNTLLIQICMF